MNFPALSAPQDKFGVVVRSVRDLTRSEYPASEYASLVVRTGKASQCLMVPIFQPDEETEAMSEQNALVPIQFYGDTLEAVKKEDGKVWVNLRRCCENLGVSLESQMAKLKAKPWATMMEIIMVAEDGKDRPVTAVDLETLPGWLFSIDARKVKEQVREKLARYQREAAKVLADHFYGRTPVNHAEDATINRLSKELARMQLLYAEIRQEMRAIPGTNPTLPRYTVHERCRIKGWLTTTSKQRGRIRRLANWLLELRHGETPDMIGGVLCYHSHQIACLDEAIDRTKDEYQKLESPGIFANAKG